MERTRSGEMASVQIGRMGILDVSTGDFGLSDGQVFNVKNEDSDAVWLEVNLAGMAAGEFVETRFDVGWNPEIVRVVRQNGGVYGLKYGY